MNKSEQKRFDELYRKHLRALKLQGMSDKTIEAYSRAVRRISAWFDCCPDRLEPGQAAGVGAVNPACGDPVPIRNKAAQTRLSRFTQNRRNGLDVTAETCIPEWYGDTMDDHGVVEALMGLETRENPH